MNLRNVDNYSIGIDLGTNSVGWAVIDENGDICHFKGKPTWGSRLFKGAETAASARAPRGARRRLVRRKWRLGLLQEFFEDEIAKVDPNFFIRLNESRLVEEDKSFDITGNHWPLFNGSDFSEHDYYKKYPTIYHLREWLMDTDEKADPRLIYLALHNIVKHRGNFLHQDNPGLSAANSDIRTELEGLQYALNEWASIKEPDSSMIELDIDDVEIVLNARKSPSSKVDQLIPLFATTREDAKRAKVLCSALVGLKADFNKVFGSDYEGASLRLSDDENVEKLISALDDDDLFLFESMQKVYSAYILHAILSSAPGKTISSNKVADYERYGRNLATLKALVRKYNPDSYDEFFRGEHWENTDIYDPAKAKGYTRYNLGTSKSGSGGKPYSYEDFYKDVKKLFADTEAVDDERYLEMIADFETQTFLRRLKTSDNGSIPYQLHLEEMHAILEKQGKHYPFLLENQSKIESLVSFRIPYYVGPLSTKNARLEKDQPGGKMRFAWSKRIEGQENAAIKPWNWEEVIDKNQSAEDFILRMTGTCTYLQDEPVLPRCSLLYEEFCVLNELNGVQWMQDGMNWKRLDYKDRIDIVDELFKKGTVTHKKFKDWMKQRNWPNTAIKGTQGETKFESRLSSYIFFTKDVFGVDELPEKYIPMVEEIILWNTLFEDRGILKEKISAKYGDALDEEQIQKVCKKRFQGWGKLSKRLLCEMKVDTPEGSASIMDIMREGSRVAPIGKAMVFQEVIRDSQFGFMDLIDEFNAEKVRDLSVNDLPGSPALRRSINQTLRIIEEISGIAGKAPNSIYLEVTRDDDLKQRGKRTTQKIDALKAATESFKGQCKDYNPAIYDELKALGNSELDRRVELYFIQHGKSMYSGKALNIDRLVTDCEIDHIIPQSYVKDDSIENTVLVLKGENQSKSDALLISKEIQNKMRAYWKSLYEAKLIGEKKYNNLLRDHISDKQMKGFINRQIVETSQSLKAVRQILEQRYPETVIRSIKASLTSQLRAECGFVKCRAANHYHHAHDAYLAAQLGRFIDGRHPGVFDEPIRMQHAMKKFIKEHAESIKHGLAVPGHSTFIISSFMKDGFDKETGEVKIDSWDVSFEIGRMRKCFDYKDCYISRMPEETSGAFWDATIYSPRAGKSVDLPLKEGLAVEKYGSYSREQFAYFFVYKVKNKKNGKLSFEFAPVPVRIASSLKQNPDKLEEYARGLVDESKYEFIEISRRKILKYQLIELDGNRLYITGKEEARNAREIAFSLNEYGILTQIQENDGNISADERIRIADTITKYCLKMAPKLATQLKIEDVCSDIAEADSKDKTLALISVVMLVNAQVNMINLEAVGGSKYSGCIKPTYSKELSDPNKKFYFIDQSVTGMFERRERLEL